MPSNKDKSDAYNSSSGDDVEIFETLFREELDALKPDKQEKNLLQPDGKEEIGALEKSGKRSHRLSIVLSAFLLTALGAFSINYFGILDLSKFMPFSEQTQKAITPPRVAKKPPVEAGKGPTRLAGRPPHKTKTPVSPNEAASQKMGPATKKRPVSVLSKNGPGIIKKQPRPETTARAGKPSRSAGRRYPYSVYLGSYRTTEGLQKAVSAYRKKGLSPYWVKIDLGEKGMWFRVFTGFFEKGGEADAFIRENQIPGAAAKHTRYTVLVGSYKSEEEVNTKKRELRAIGCCPYDVKDMNGACRLYTGAFYQMAHAQKHRADLASKGIRGEVVER